MKQYVEILEIIRPILADVFKTDPNNIKMETVPKNIEKWDSLGHIMMFAALEKNLKVTFTMREIMMCDSMVCLLHMLRGRMK